ncbi:hypothetical protein P43SY_010891 [Pythium insidiosum]|uniref:Chromo domain-containing protein n=1 Tax=Pythium insidiosum TaxID=114742 RepID=A0AAD5LRJ3_PYTIN|nr:hypothetical protein P43SY_010891 [Pythium insidiosum]
MSVDSTALTGAGATAAIVNSQCFSLAFGGAGGSFAGRGGDGYDSPYRRTQAYGSVYSDSSVPDLLGGSGGAGGGLEPLDVFPVVQPTKGGAGGGALHLSAVNDLVIGENGRLVVNGAPGATGYTAGGGGSAGSILLDVGGTVSHHGVIEASFSTWQQGTVLVNGGASQDSKRAGSAGSTFVRVLTALSYRVDPSLGAAGTAKSLLVSGHEDVFAKRTTDAKLLDTKVVSDDGRKSRMFLVSWEGYEDQTWEPERNLPSNLVTEFCQAMLVSNDADESSDTEEPITDPTPEDTRVKEAGAALETSDDFPSSATASRPDESDASEEYEVEKLLKMRTTTVKGVAVTEYLVAWLGFDDQTWEPEGNLPEESVKKYRDQMERERIEVKHQMEVNTALSLKDSNGNDMTEFPDDACYCSAVCYNRRMVLRIFL